MTAVPVEGETPGAAKDEHRAGTPGPAEAQTSAPAPRPDPQPAPRTDPRTDPPSVPAPRAESPAVSEPEPEPDAGHESEQAPDAVPPSGGEHDAAPASGLAAASAPEPESVPGAASEPEAKVVPVPSPGAEPAAGVKSGTGAEPGAAAAAIDPDPDPDPDPGPGARPRPRPESDSEKTSQFIALKPLDAAPSASVPVPKWAKGSTPAAVPAPVPVEPAPAVPTAAPAPARGTAPVPATAPGRLPGGADGGPGDGPAQGSSAVPEGTTEQPLPALDLLAQLTNTPPPPATPGRTVARRFRIWVPPLLLLVAVLAVVQALRPLPDAVLTSGDAASSVALDGRFEVPWPEKGQAAVRIGGAGDVGTFGEQKAVPTASVAKVMTAYVILKDHPLKKDEDGPQIEVDAKAVADGNSASESRVQGLTTGTRFSQQNMLKMLMIPSGNNIARLLARWDTGSDSEAAFVEKMNAEAKALGMTDTTYTDPSGLDAKTVSTATDQLKLAEEVMKFDAFRAIVMLPNATVPGLSEPLINNNDDLLIAGLSIKGIKTGSSSAAGGALMWAAYKTVGDKTPLILGTMLDQHVTGADPDGANSLKLVKQNSKKVIEAVRAALTSAAVVKKGQVVGYVDDGLGTRTPVVATRDTAAVAVPGQQLELSLAVGAKGLPAEAPAGTEIGVLTVGTGPGAPTVPVALRSDLSAPSLGAKLVRLR
ncbi:D-alanyl-D-alanine carboxypeptidase [Streptomyces sp. NPDC058401]|uniref:D-alanyl-D-alanine carboxypeptidase family protein n=1 Tax=Streptomyces sp. NPDC058401 TaxID=3346480 RepID=UPI003653CD52